MAGSPADPGPGGPGLAPGRAPALSSPPPPPTQGTVFQPSLGTLRRGVPAAASSSPQAAPPHCGRSGGFAAFRPPPRRGPAGTGDARFSQRRGNRRRSARCLPLSIGSAVVVGLRGCSVSRRRPCAAVELESAVIPPISCPAQAPPGRLWPAGLRQASRRQSRSSAASARKEQPR